MRTPAPEAAIGLGGLILSLGLLAGCAASTTGVAQGPVSDRVREEHACLRASVGQSDDGFTRLPFDIDRDAYQRCMEKREHDLPPSGLQAP